MKILWQVTIAVVVILIIFLPTISKLHELESKKENLENQIKIYRVKNSSLEEEVYRLKNDPDCLEAVARDKLKVAKEGEVVYKIETEEEGKR